MTDDREAESDVEEAATETHNPLGDDETDIFDEMEADVDDPFAELGERTADSEPAEPEPIEDDEPDGPSPAGSDDPLDELGPSRGDDAAGDLADAFERMDVGEVADEDVWESLDEEEAGDPLAPGAAEPLDTEADEIEHVVDKRTYCQQCPHFSAPPEIACTHEGTTIVEAVDFDEFRVRNCPMASADDPTFDADR